MAPDAELTAFARGHVDTVLAWVQSPAELEAWVSRTDFPLDPSVFDAWHADPDVHAFVLADEGELRAYGEIWEDREEDEAELARIIVAPRFRGRGIGRRFVTLLAAEAVRRGFGATWVRVLPTNAPAHACYRSAGFHRAGRDEEERFNRGQPRKYVWMRLRAVSA
jgi:[ribosomal protein S18]-alanine N-acetyltransferase